MKIYMSSPISSTEKYYAPHNFMKNKSKSIKQLCFLNISWEINSNKNFQFVSFVNFLKCPTFGLILQKSVWWEIRNSYCSKTLVSYMLWNKNSIGSMISFLKYFFLKLIKINLTFAVFAYRHVLLGIMYASQNWNVAWNNVCQSKLNYCLE